MTKVNRTVCLESETNERLSRVENASLLIERLLRNHFSLEILKVPTENTVSDQEKKLEVEIKQIDEKKKLIEQSKGIVHSQSSLKQQLADIGVVNEKLIQLLKNSKVEPSIYTVKELKVTYSIEQAETIWQAWHILHKKEEKKEKEKS